MEDILNEAKKAKAKSKNDKPKVEKSTEPIIDPETGLPAQETKPQKALTGNPSNPIIVFPPGPGGVSPVDPRNPMRNSQAALLQNDASKPGMLLREYIDYAKGKIVGGDLRIPTQAARSTENQHPNHTGDVGMDDAESEEDSEPQGPAQMGDRNQRLRRRTQKREQQLATSGGNNDEYV